MVHGPQEAEESFFNRLEKNQDLPGIDDPAEEVGAPAPKSGGISAQGS